jgi:ketosteroid isomerase-like protein
MAIRNGFFFITVFVFLISCTSKKPDNNVVEDKFLLMDTDRSFSKLSEQKGIKFALIQFIDTKGVLLKPASIPIIGGQAINYVSQLNDSSYTMTWEPKGGDVASSGDMGYTYGLYSVKPNDRDTVLYGTYVSIWKQQPDGKWKFVLQSQNEGIE